MNIERIELLYAGSCENNEKHIFKGAESKKLRFPAACLLIRHAQQGWVLLDTGYSQRVFRGKGLIRRLYRTLNPVTVSRKEQIDAQLRARDIQPCEVQTVILSHLHPDHVGGTTYFPQAQFIVSQKALEEFTRPSFKSLIFQELLPDDFQQRAQPIHTFPDSIGPFREAYDLFRDGSVYLIPLDGHAKGQMGLYIPQANLLFAADASWRSPYLHETRPIRMIPRFLQNHFPTYLQTQAMLRDVEAAGIRVLFSHDPILENGVLL